MMKPLNNLIKTLFFNKDTQLIYSKSFIYKTTQLFDLIDEATQSFYSKQYIDKLTKFFQLFIDKATQ